MMNISETIETSNVANEKTEELQVSFSHLQIYVDHLEDLAVYKRLEDSLNEFFGPSKNDHASASSVANKRKEWESMMGAPVDEKFVSKNRDVVKQLLVGFGFRVTGYRYPSDDNKANTKSVLVTSRDPNGVQIVITAKDETANSPMDDYQYFDAGTLSLALLLFQYLVFS